MSASDPETPTTPYPSAFNYVLSFLLVGVAWGFTTPFIRRAAKSYTAPSHPSITDPTRSYVSRQMAKIFFSVVGLLRTPSYAVPLLVNLTGSIWFFLLVGQAGVYLLSLLFPQTYHVVSCRHGREEGHSWCSAMLEDDYSAEMTPEFQAILFHYFFADTMPELSLTVPITNSLAFLFTVLGEYVAEGKLITRDTGIGMVLVCGGIALCVISKS